IFFFFHAEDGIRYFHVTGVQTCALPICQMAGKISLHIPWDIPANTDHIKALAKDAHLEIDAMNSNTFQDQPDQDLSYKFGSLSHTDVSVRNQAIDHNKTVIDYGKEMGSKSLTVWLAEDRKSTSMNS